MTKFLAIFSLITALTAVTPSQFARTGDISDEMIPEGWEYVGSATGDLNGDGRADMIVVARPDQKPVAAIYWDNGDEKWQLFKEYGNAFRAFDKMNYTPEFLMEITENGDLKIELYDPEDFDAEILASYTFHYKKGDFVLVEEIHYDGTPDKAKKGKALKFGDFQIE
ncbi:MAG: FG-GAP repeat protein [Bacteroidales bacterium]|nr:FG-GAP repeat protein [Bacteroidales bacterium]